ncbi:ribonuclease inhibitor-like isoform X1 [Hypanus sabinus]|uniref:ribonuclease inhibitor-like isoform X1 n=1 Tax=Hypanus sabinus TaxID=79690 RepID=UPI0028C4B282|nr:ribonuclease inhibitor-like isoform X1 [Hypanus sabinus]
MTARGLEEFLGPFPHQTTCRVIDWVKEEVKGQSGNTDDIGRRRLLNTLHYLFESQNRGLAQAALGSLKTLSFRGMTLTPVDCAVLSHAIGLCDTIKELDLQGCHIQCEGIQRLGPGLNKCQELRLGENDLGDSGVKLVLSALRNPECKIQKLWLTRVGLTDSGAEDLVSFLSTKPSLTELDLNYYEPGYSGAKLVFLALGNPECKMQKLELERVGLTDSGAEDLVSALRTNRSLTELYLSVDELGDSKLRLVSAALRNPECKIQKLRLGDVGLTDSGAEELASALSTNPSLTELNLTGNKLGDSGVKLVLSALRNPECKIQKLRLGYVGLTDSGAEDLVSALSTKPSLTELHLSVNDLGDSGVKLVLSALRNAECKIQKLWMGGVGLTDSGAEDLVSALSTKPSLTELNLGFNSLTDRSVPDLRRLILTLPSLVWIRLGENQFSETGMKELRSLQGVRSGLRVDL